jgi:hypothetical protein
MTSRFAENANYWDTAVKPESSQNEINEMLEKFGADAVMMARGKAGGRFAWLVRFQWQGRNYRFAFTPLECRAGYKSGRFGGKRHTHDDQARYQMGRIAVNFVKAILTAAEAQPHALFGFMELPGAASGSFFPPVAAEVDVSALIGNAPLLQLPEFIDGSTEC